MIVRVWQDADPQKGLVDETVLNAGDYTTVKSGKFNNLKESKTELLLNCTGQNSTMMTLSVEL